LPVFDPCSVSLFVAVPFELTCLYLLVLVFNTVRILVSNNRLKIPVLLIALILYKCLAIIL
jgi:hypothetical protein